LDIALTCCGIRGKVGPDAAKSTLPINDTCGALFVFSDPSFTCPHLRRLSHIAMAASVDQKLLRQTKFPPEFSQKVDMQKVNVEVMKK
jgi:hypothetical protein